MADIAFAARLQALRARAFGGACGGSVKAEQRSTYM
jgi:hypothetical protein